MYFQSIEGIHAGLNGSQWKPQKAEGSLSSRAVKTAGLGKLPELYWYVVILVSEVPPTWWERTIGDPYDGEKYCPLMPGKGNGIYGTKQNTV